jgi:hypothetical protein
MIPGDSDKTPGEARAAAWWAQREQQYQQRPGDPGGNRAYPGTDTPVYRTAGLPSPAAGGPRRSWYPRRGTGACGGIHPAVPGKRPAGAVRQGRSGGVESVLPGGVRPGYAAEREVRGSESPDRSRGTRRCRGNGRRLSRSQLPQRLHLSRLQSRGRPALACAPRRRHHLPVTPGSAGQCP